MLYVLTILILRRLDKSTFLLKALARIASETANARQRKELSATYCAVGRESHTVDICAY